VMLPSLTSPANGWTTDVGKEKVYNGSVQEAKRRHTPSLVPLPAQLHQNWRVRRPRRRVRLLMTRPTSDVTPADFNLRRAVLQRQSAAAPIVIDRSVIIPVVEVRTQ